MSYENYPLPSQRLKNQRHVSRLLHEITKILFPFQVRPGPSILIYMFLLYTNILYVVNLFQNDKKREKVKNETKIKRTRKR